MTYEELFIDKDDVLLIRKELVRVLGDLNEAVVLNQLHYWININKKAEKNAYDDKYWVFNTYQMWKDTDFDFWSIDTIKRTFSRLEKKGVVISANYNKMKMDKTKWYSIDYKKLQDMIDEYVKGQNAPTERATCTKQYQRLLQRIQIPEITPENTDRDYNSENIGNSFSKEKEENRNSPDGEHRNSDFPEREVQRMAKKDLKDYSAEDFEEAESRLPVRAKDIIYDWTKDKDLADNIYDFFKYFLEERRNYTRYRHYPLTDNVLRKVLIAVTESVSIERKDGYIDTYRALVNNEDDDWKIIVDEYFNTDFSKECDYSLVHFSSETVLTNIMNHAGKYEWCESETW